MGRFMQSVPRYFDISCGSSNSDWASTSRGEQSGGFEWALESANFLKIEDPFLTAFPEIRKKVYIE
jgi:hypothetical protein